MVRCKGERLDGASNGHKGRSGGVFGEVRRVDEGHDGDEDSLGDVPLPISLVYTRSSSKQLRSSIGPKREYWERDQAPKITMIKFILVQVSSSLPWTSGSKLTPQNRQGKTRLSKWYTPYDDDEKVRLRGEVHRLIAPRDQKYQSNFVEVS